MKKWFRYGLSLLLLLVLIYFFWPLLGEIKAAAELFRNAKWMWLPVALLIQVISYIFLTWLNVLALKPFPGKIGFWQLAALLTAMAFIQVAIPSAGASGVALRVRLLGKFGYKAEEALLSLAVETVAEIIALVNVAGIGVVYLLQAHQLSVMDIFWLVLTGMGLLAVLWATWRLLSSRKRSQKLLLSWIELWNHLFGRFRSLDREKSLDRLLIFQENTDKYRQLPVWKFCLAAYGKVLLDVGTMWACFLLVGYAIPLGTLLTGYGLVLTFSGTAVLPGGVGMTDAYVPVIFSWLSVTGAVALAAGLLYRLIAYWLLRFIGFINWQILEERY